VANLTTDNGTLTHLVIGATLRPTREAGGEPSRQPPYFSQAAMKKSPPQGDLPSLPGEHQMPSDHEAGPCAALPHQYFTYMAVWCPHRQQWTVTAGAYGETGSSSDPVDYRTRRVELGPFDTAGDAARLLGTWIGADLGDSAGSPSRLPGS
jgi:hypothetical protein